MKRKIFTSLVAGALLAASSAGVAQTAAAPEPAFETVSAENRLSDEAATTLGVLFGIFVVIIFIWGAGGSDDPLSP